MEKNGMKWLMGGEKKGHMSLTWCIVQGRLAFEDWP
jgi:hypothetical protein